jgi:hypothetical protein
LRTWSSSPFSSQRRSGRRLALLRGLLAGLRGRVFHSRAAPLQLHEARRVDRHGFLYLSSPAVVANRQRLGVGSLQILARALHRLDGVAHKLQIAVVDLVMSVMNLLTGYLGLPFSLRTSKFLLLEPEFEFPDAVLWLYLGLFFNLRLFFNNNSHFWRTIVFLYFYFKLFFVV